MRKCSECNIDKEWDDFYFLKRGDERTARCIDCYANRETPYTMSGVIESLVDGRVLNMYNFNADVMNMLTGLSSLELWDDADDMHVECRLILSTKGNRLEMIADRHNSQTLAWWQFMRLTSYLTPMSYSEEMREFILETRVQLYGDE